MSPAVADGERALSIRLRRMVLDDLDEVFDLEALVGARGWSRRSFEAELAEPVARRYLVAEEAAAGSPDGAGRIVGFAGIRLVLDEAHVTNVAVLPEARRRGVGARLLRALLDDARRAGATTASLEVRVGNTSARALYRQLGFTDEGLRPRYYADGEDAVIMWCRDLAEGRG